MRIRNFSMFIKHQLQPFVLKDTDLVIDGQNFLYNAYSDSKLPFAFGAESDKFADYLRQYLQNFKQANVKCYFILKGGHGDILTKLRKQHDIERHNAGDFVPGSRLDGDNIVIPIFTKDIYKQVLNEMGFQYSISTFEAKADCVALARKLNCPILSNDVEFCFFGVPYIPSRELTFEEKNNAFRCGIFYLADFMEKFNLNEEKLATFVLLMDENIFPPNHFANFMKSIKIPFDFKKRIHSMLFWLSKTPERQAVEKVFLYIDDASQKKFMTEMKYIRGLIDLKPASTITVLYMEDENAVQVEPNDSKWFQKGVSLKNIPITYINLYRWKYMSGSWVIEDVKNDALLFSMEIVKYAFDLLTNFENEGFTFAFHISKEIQIEKSIQKPKYEATQSVFENGWTHLRELKLFEHFLDESFGKFDVTNLDSLSEDVKLLMIASVYFSIKKENVQKEIYSVLLSHVMLGVVFEKINEGTENHLDTVTMKDCKTAASIMDKYFKLTPKEEKEIFDRKTLHPLVEFQHCLHQLNYLNTLCANSFQPTIYRKTYNGTFVYKIMYAMIHYDGDDIEFVEHLLKPAPTVLMYFKKLVQTYEKTINQQFYE